MEPHEIPETESSSYHKGRLYALLIVAIATIILWNIPFGVYVLYPFSILGTWFHEMGHGLTAILVGGSFKKLEIYANGSGIAFFTIPSGFSILGAIVAAGGLLGPPVIGAICLVSSKSSRTTTVALVVFELFIAISIVIWIRTWIGVIILIAIGAILFFILWKGSEKIKLLTIQIIGVQAILSTYRQLDYLFMGEANVGGKQMLSDTGQIASHLFLPYWFWGALIAAISFFLLYSSLKYALKN